MKQINGSEQLSALSVHSPVEEDTTPDPGAFIVSAGDLTKPQKCVFQDKSVEAEL